MNDLKVVDLISGVSGLLGAGRLAKKKIEPTFFHVSKGPFDHVGVTYRRNDAKARLRAGRRCGRISARQQKRALKAARRANKLESA